MDAAIHTWIADLLKGEIVQKENEPSALYIGGEKLQRVRIYGTAVSTQELIVDDGTGSILVRSFDKPIIAELGDPVLVIGRPRLYNGEHYVIGEIVKKIDPIWLAIIKKKNKKAGPLELIRELDKGEGADYEEVISQLGSKGESQITHLLATGEIFETRPGKLKVLE